LQQLTNNRNTSKGETKCQIQKFATHNVAIRSKPEEKKPVTQPNMPAPPKQEITERTAQNSAAGARET